MPHNPALLKNRNNNIKKSFRLHRKRNPKWTVIAVIQEVAKDFFLSPSTVAKVLKKADESDAIPCADTIIKYTRLSA